MKEFFKALELWRSSLKEVEGKISQKMLLEVFLHIFFCDLSSYSLIFRTKIVKNNQL